MTNFQRIGSISNAHIGRDFEVIAYAHFIDLGYDIIKDVGLSVGHERKKNHRFDLGTPLNAEEKIIIECKSHRWTRPSDNVPSAKLTVWNETMNYFHLAPEGYRKILFVLRDFSVKRNETLGEYYIRTYGHLIPKDVEIMEYDEVNQSVRVL
ncbi:hypothetical protein MHZ95_00235 [Sporosarcina sp. ACRSM]|uniref:hypothetical protein n=1 Tax=Sporosarcina sp. ACRSM TaxID=2918216 RepID=UPI001EF483D8|nr:hypothetical protein [Sporosarcina sp. ACRSM]MCG7333698.1 hypothetical protein [Sporosarcina sp. ACRSM]